MMVIKYLRYNEINLEKWDLCIENASNSLIYAESWYLNIVSPNWHALVYGDYEFVMPLPAKRKYGIWYLYQPLYTQQLGVFGKEPSKGLVLLFLNSIPNKFLFIDLNMNNLLEDLTKLPNYELGLSIKYTALQKKYGNNLRRNLKKANKTRQIIEDNFDLKKIIYFLEENGKYKLEKNYYKVLEELILTSLKNKKGKLFSVYVEEELTALAFFLETKSRLIYLSGATSIKGREVQSMSFLIDEYIKSNCESEKVLDFEGSKDSNVARFYRGFGAKFKGYYRLKSKLDYKFFSSFLNFKKR
jgi:hypothetical protein